MSSYERWLAEKNVKAETAVNFAIKRLREIAWKYDLPFISDDMKDMITELNRLRNYLDNEIHPLNNEIN